MGRDPAKSSERPRRAAKRGRRSDESRRARLYLAELEWLAGFADGGGWRIATDEVLAFDGVRISKTRRAARTVLREHPVALRELVGDVDRWWQIVDAKLSWCSARASGKSIGAFDPTPYLPPRHVRGLARLRATRLAAAAAALATAWIADLDRVEAGLAWLAAHESELATLLDHPHVKDVGFERLVWLLARLALTGERRRGKATSEASVAALIALLAIDAPDPAAALDVTRNLENRLAAPHADLAPVPNRSAPQAVRWILKLATRDGVARERSLALIGVTKLAEAFAPWQRWESEHAGLFARAAELVGHRFDVLDRAAHVQRVVEKLDAARKRAPQVVLLADLIFEIDMLGDARFARFHSSIVRLLAALPPPTRPRMLLHVARIAATADDDDHVEWLWDALAAAFERGAPIELLAPWHAALRGGGSIWIDSDLVEHAKSRADVERMVRLLAERARHEPPGKGEAKSIAIWSAAGLPDDIVLDAASELRELSIEADVARAIIAVADGTAPDIVALARAMAELVGDMGWHPKRRLVAFIEYAAEQGATWLVRGALAAKQGARLSEVANVVMLVPRSRRPKLIEQNTAWIDRYPVALAVALQRLASVDPEAERTAAKRLADDFPDPENLRREIAALRARGATGPAAKRLANLEQRLSSPKRPSAKRLANLVVRIETTAREVALSRWIAEATRISGERLVRTFCLPSWPVWADHTNREILFALLELEDSADRDLAGRLLQARNGPPPWDLRDEPANRRFLDRMRTAGVDPTPWLDSTPRVIRPTKGEPLSLALCSDPLEVFAMGAHFDTCLSPGGGNFFSVVANAADINKRVLYARRDGRVIGRCLLAITNGFSVLTFKPYCHESLDFAAIVRDFALDLATRMGTAVTARGSVDTLLARDWYDDGARDLVGRFTGLDDDFDFDKDDLVARLREALGHDLDDVTLPIVLDHRGLRGQPRHLAPLVPFVLASQVSQTRIDAAQLALDNGDLELADRLLGDHSRAIDLHNWPRGALLARLRPSETLAQLRRTRHRTVRRWSDDGGDRIALAGIALEALARPRQAAALYRLAATREIWLADLMRERLQALGEPLEGEVAS